MNSERLQLKGRILLGMLELGPSIPRKADHPIESLKHLNYSVDVFILLEGEVGSSEEGCLDNFRSPKFLLFNVLQDC